MTPGERITSSAIAALRGDIRVPDRPGLCLALVRVVIEHAFQWPSHHWYRWRTIIVPRSTQANQDS